MYYLGFAGLEWAGRCLEHDPEFWEPGFPEPHHKPCAMKGNGFIWQAGAVLC
jgi:hypothetical protein